MTLFVVWNLKQSKCQSVVIDIQGNKTYSCSLWEAFSVLWLFSKSVICDMIWQAQFTLKINLFYFYDFKMIFVCKDCLLGCHI